MTYLSENKEGQVYFEAVLRSETGDSIFAPETYLEPNNIQQFAPPAGRGIQAANILQSLGFRIQQIGTFSISAEGPRELWERIFGTRVEARRQTVSPSVGEVTYLSHVAGVPFSIPSELSALVERAYPQSPPILFESPLPPRVTYHHLTVPADVATVCRSTPVHKVGVTGKGVLVAMVDTGFYKHPFYEWHGYNYQATLAPDSTNLERDESGHGTAEAANIFANAPDIDFIGVKMGGNPTLAFKIASDLHPAIISNSWGYHLIDGNHKPLTSLPNALKPLEAAVIEAVQKRGITVCFSGGNGQIAFPGMMPNVISVGGVYAHESIDGDDFKLEASNYASSFDSQIYPGRHVPDMCGLVGMQPKAIYIMLPVEPGDEIDKGLGGNGYPEKDETGTNDGWAVISGTSAACPQIAGVCALLKQVQPGLSPTLIKSILKASARDVKTGKSIHGQPAGNGHDGATGTGLVDAYAAYKLARSAAINP
ncbi:S8 family serine peptidase [Mastigocoleus sp. MO_188.B34]|uniref:S8 family serine peptidase n=1 Tax=Mastigocoleus sp. MO_188.B34 TaxID=3036635 RepID=UPI00260DCF6B|nr:S8 family serine peptidase [Mastigocoleus sp. MO_188.B34]MDJ0694174.1 S8 family serine peptidase [Mastigocoleus sp. MO_188.B34]